MWFRRIARLVVLLLLLLIVIGFAFFTPSDYETLGYTDWDCRNPVPTAWVKHTLVLETPAKAVTVAIHEQKHVEQMLRFGSCNQYKSAWWASPDSLGFEMEAEAFCAHAQAEVELGIETVLENAIDAHAFTLATAYRFGVTQDSARARITFYCQEE